MTGPATPSRDRVLARIRTANHAANRAPNREVASEATIPREYEGALAAHDPADSSDTAEVLALFVERLEEYDARVFRVRREEIAAKAFELLRAQNRSRVVVPPGLDPAWQAEGIDWVADHSLTYEEIDAAGGVMTAATAGVAVSGSIVLQHGPAEGRRVLTLLPDYHLCVIEAAQVTATLPEAFRRLDPSRPVTFFSGPSATADIEMTRIKGVHGPRFLDVLLVDA